MIKRYYQNLEKYLEKNKVLVIYGPRRVGKTTLLNHYLEGTEYSYVLGNGDELRIQEVFNSRDFQTIKGFVGNNQLVALDEAQHIPNVGMGLKILVDQMPEVRVIATGSSSFELAGQVGEPLTGRKHTLTLYPISMLELSEDKTPFQMKGQIEERLIYGSYPRVVTAEFDDRRKMILEELVDSYLLKDILKFKEIKGAKVILDLLRLLAFQLGNEVSLSELGQSLGLNYKTVRRYLDLLAKSFVIFELRGFSRNLRKEITKKSKYYFYDLGVRNAVISNFNKLNLRNDKGELWENFIIAERIKKQSYSPIYANNYFWRTWDGQEIDWVEEREGKLFGYEIKWQKSAPAPNQWIDTYEEAEFKVINQDNFLNFIT